MNNYLFSALGKIGGARPSGRLNVGLAGALGKCRNVAGNEPRGSGVNAALRSTASTTLNRYNASALGAGCE